MKLSMLAMALATAASAVVLPMAIAPVAGAEVCAGATGRHFAAGGCTNVYGDVAVASAAVPFVMGETPCYTVEGVPYYTPPGDPC